MLRAVTKYPRQRGHLRWLSPIVERSAKLSTSSSSNGNVIVEQSKGKSRRRRRSSRLPSTDEIPSYKEFVHRFTVLSLYRNYLKSIRNMPHNQEDLKQQVQQEFRTHKDDKDPFNIQRALAEGQRRYEELQQLTGEDNKFEGDSWIKINDPEDPRGRVGEGWPWQQS